MHRKSYRIFIFPTVLLLIIFIPAVFSIASSQDGEIKVIITGFKSNKGEARYGLYNSKKTFLKGGKTFRKDALPIKNKKCEFIIRDVPYGEYALAVGHDKNGNGKIDKLFPMEPKGISNYIKRLWSRPKFKKAKFVLDSESITIEMKVF